jgi:hypothetical protein
VRNLGAFFGYSCGMFPASFLYHIPLGYASAATRRGAYGDELIPKGKSPVV